MLGGPALDERGDGFAGDFVGGEVAGGVAVVDAEAVVDGAVEGGGVAEELGVGAFEVAHFFDDVDAGGGVEDFEEDAGAFETQVEQHEVDVVVAAGAGLEGVGGALFFFEAHAHGAEVLAGAAALAVAAPVDFLEAVEESCGAFGFSGDGAGFHVGDAFPGFGVFGEVIEEGRFGLDEGAGAAVGAEAGVDAEQLAVAGVGGEDVDHPVGGAGPEDVFFLVAFGEGEDEVGVGAEVELAHAEAAEGDDHHLVARLVAVADWWVLDAGLFDGHAVGGADGGVGEVGGAFEGFEDGCREADAGGLDAEHFAAIPLTEAGGAVESFLDGFFDDFGGVAAYVG